MIEILEIILKGNTKYLCELYQYANQNYFIAYIDDDKERMNYLIAFHLICTSIILIISEINGGK